MQHFLSGNLMAIVMEEYWNFIETDDDFLPKLVHAILKHLRSSSSRSRIFINGRIILNRSPFLIFSRATGLG